MNINPTADGRITPIFEERLRDMGDWLKVNGDAIYATKPWKHQSDPTAKNVWYTMKETLQKRNIISKESSSGQGNGNKTPKNSSQLGTSTSIKSLQKGNITTVYAILLEWPDNPEQFTLGAFVNETVKTVSMLGVAKPLKFSIDSKKGLIVDLSSFSFHMLPSKLAWTLAIN